MDVDSRGRLTQVVRTCLITLITKLSSWITKIFEPCPSLIGVCTAERITFRKMKGWPSSL